MRVQVEYMKIWVKGTLWIWDEFKNSLRNAQGEELGREERDGGDEKRGRAERKDFC